jgi:membrane protease YdiL (CAAX protease family)
MSSEPNTPLDSFSSPPQPPDGGVSPILQEQRPAPIENPVWSGWDVTLIAALTFVLPFLLLFVTVGIAKKFFHPAVPFVELGQKPVYALISELAGYLVVLAFMIMFIEGRYRVSFFDAIRWNWPGQGAWLLFGSGIVLLVAIQVLGHFLPVPKEVPFDKFFENARDAYFTSIFAISLGPFMEELLFRGFLYPVLARRIGMIASIVLTGIAFGMVHGLQLAFAWGPVLMLSLVGIVLTTVRAVRRSVSASLIVHIAYNLTLTVITFVGTSGFKHLEKLTQ